MPAVFMTRVTLPDYRLQAFGAAASIYDRVEISLARQTFELKNIPFGEREINQQILGLKARVYGDIVYGAWPQLAAGIQYKELDNDFIAGAVGAEDTDNGTDLYLAASKAHLGALFGYNLVCGISHSAQPKRTSSAYWVLAAITTTDNSTLPLPGWTWA